MYKRQDLCDLLSLKWHHETDSRRSKEGFPDLVIAGPEGVAFAELKSEKGRATAAQTEWIAALCPHVYAAFWRPSDWPMVYNCLYELAGKTPPPHFEPR